LFLDRARAVQPDFAPSGDTMAAVAEICRRLDGLPLAIELAAGPVAALGAKNAAARLVSRLAPLNLGHRTVIPRQQTIKATLDWSYNLLSDGERIVLRRIACFVGDFPLEGAQQVAGELDREEIFDAVAGLVEKSLVSARIDGAQRAYRLLDTTRVYALEKLEEHTEVDVVLRRHAEYVAGYLESHRSALLALSKVERDTAHPGQLGNIRAALEWSFGPNGDDEIATRLAAVSTPLFFELSLLVECRAWAERALARLGDQHQNSRRKMEISTSLSLALMHSEGSSELVRNALSRALDIAVMQGDFACELQLLSGLFMHYRGSIEVGAALDIASRSPENQRPR